MTQAAISPVATSYIHVDHLGSLDVVTDPSGNEIERRSYDAFGARRNPIWGAPTPASFPAGATPGFTGHVSDEDLGLVHMKGRMYDPRLGRFLTPDPIIAASHAGVDSTRGPAPGRAPREPT